MGPAGPQGSAGPQGPQGIPGPIGPQGVSGVRSTWAEATNSVPIADLDLSVTIVLERPGTISVQGNVNVFTSKDAFAQIYLNDAPIGPPGYTSVPNVWSNIPVFAMRTLPAGRYTISVRGSANGSNARAGSRVITVMAF